LHGQRDGREWQRQTKARRDGHQQAGANDDQQLARDESNLLINFKSLG
jgi:hypothetical protein